MARTLVYDATLAFVAPDRADRLDIGLARALARLDDPRVVLVRHGPFGLVRLRDIVLRSASGADKRASSARAWLLDGSRRAYPRRRVPNLATPMALATGWFEKAYAPPSGSTYVAAGWRRWRDGRLGSLLLERPDLTTIAILDRPLELDYPEYAAPGEAAQARAAWTAIGRYASQILAPSALPAARPSPLAGSLPARLSADLAKRPFFIQVGPAEARANTLLLLQIWRSLCAAGGATPKLLLAGELGVQTAEVKPMLDWCEAISSHVLLSGSLDAQALRELIGQAQALLAPDFVGCDTALLRDARSLGTPTIATASLDDATPSHRRIDPLAGAQWRQAIVEAAQAPARAEGCGNALPDWPNFAKRLVEAMIG